MGHTVQRVIILVLTLGVIAFGVLVWSYGQYVRPGPLPAPITLVIPRGAGVDEIAARLSRTGVLADPLIFRHAARLTGHDKGLRAGEYAFAAAISAREVLMLLGSGKTVVRRLTVAEGLTTREVLDRLLVTEGLDGSVEPVPEEGSLLPETYHFSYGDSRAAMVHRMSTAMQETVTTLWWQRDMDLSLRSPRQMVVLASLVEKETGLAAERSRIAAVFPQPSREGHAASVGSDRGVWADQRVRVAGPGPDPERPAPSEPLQYLRDQGPPTGAHLQPGPRVAGVRGPPGAHP